MILTNATQAATPATVSILFILVLFLKLIGAGMLLLMPFLLEEQVDRRFFKSISFWSCLFLVAAIILKQYAPFQLPPPFKVAIIPLGLLQVSSRLTLAVAILSGLLFGLFKWSEKKINRQVWLTTLFAASMLWVEGMIYSPQLTPAWVVSIVIPAYFFSAALLLGSFLMGMIFGHWYLINTEMPKKLLLRMAWILIGTLFFRILAVLVTLLLYGKLIYAGQDFLGNMISLSGHGIFFWQRVLVGLVIPMIVAAMVWSTARIGSNQSATGIMYVGIAFIFIGELAAQYLFLLSAIPL